MSDEDVVVAEVGADPIDAPNPISALLKSIEAGEYNDAEMSFNDIIGDRLQDTLDQAKVRIADKIFNAVPEEEGEEEEEDVVDFDDEDEDDNS